MVALSGNVTNLVGAYYPDFVLSARPQRPFYDEGVFIGQSTSYFPSVSGSITGSFPATDTLGILVDFAGRYTADGIAQQIYFVPTLIPSVSALNFSQLLFPVVD